jgi:hypothetical protein
MEYCLDYAWSNFLLKLIAKVKLSETQFEDVVSVVDSWSDRLTEVVASLFEVQGDIIRALESKMLGYRKFQDLKVKSHQLILLWVERQLQRGYDPKFQEKVLTHLSVLVSINPSMTRKIVSPGGDFI